MWHLILELVHSCFPSQELVSTIDPLVYPMVAWEPLLPPLGPSDINFPFESKLVVCRSSSLCSYDSSLIDSIGSRQNLHRHMECGHFGSPFGNVNPPHLHDLLDIELPSDEAILEAMTTVYILWKDLHRGLCFLPFLETF
jgi:hypothetical protein